NVAVTRMGSASASKITVAIPVPGDICGGASAGPVMLPEYVLRSAQVSGAAIDSAPARRAGMAMRCMVRASDRYREERTVRSERKGARSKKRAAQYRKCLLRLGWKQNMCRVCEINQLHVAGMPRCKRRRHRPSRIARRKPGGL